jgi:hypothetical protein
VLGTPAAPRGGSDRLPREMRKEPLSV